MPRIQTYNSILLVLPLSLMWYIYYCPLTNIKWYSQNLFIRWLVVQSFERLFPWNSVLYEGQGPRLAPHQAYFNQL